MDHFFTFILKSLHNLLNMVQFKVWTIKYINKGKVFYTDISVPVGPVYHMVHKSGVNVPSGTWL